MKEALARALPMPLVNWLRRLRVAFALCRPYCTRPFGTQEMPSASGQNSYALTAEKESAAYRRVMKKLLSYPGAGPVGPNKHWEYPWVLSNLNPAPGLTVLDAGCGRAPNQYLFAELGCRVSAIDPMENTGWHGIDRRLARKYGLSIDYRVEGMERISGPDESFDRVISVSVIEHCRAQHVKDELRTPQTAEDRALQGRMMKEMARVLKKGGLLIITLDIIFPENGALLECNVDVRNLITASGLTLEGALPVQGVYGDNTFRMEQLMAAPGLDIQDYTGVRGTSLGLIFRK
ncbi:MAG: class I SAM-dependent methyltransferase [Fibrobacterota bacterium]